MSTRHTSSLPPERKAQIRALLEAGQALSPNAGWALLDELDQTRAGRAEVLAEAKREVVVWLGKKAREYRSTGSAQHALQADAIEVMASKVDRGAVRCFLDEAGKVSPAGAEITQPADFFQPGHTYSDDEHGWKFRVDTVTTHPETGERTALGWRYWTGWEPYAYGEDDWEIHQMVGHTDVTEDGKAAAAGGEITQPAELTIYRASHDSIVMGLYTTRQAAYEHCEAYEMRDDPVSPMAWKVDEDGVAELVRIRVPRSPGAEAATGYVVTPLIVAAEYDEEADE
ncbi:hypothetical protein ACWDHW_13430 [Streptomyces melanosporofaciens]